MNSEEIARRMEHVIGDMGNLIDELKSKRLGKFIDPICWNCAKAYIFYLLDHVGPSYRPCTIWRTTKKCDFEPREGK